MEQKYELWREIILAASEEVGLDVNAEKCKYVFMCYHKNTDQSHTLTTSKSSDNVAK